MSLGQITADYADSDPEDESVESPVKLMKLKLVNEKPRQAPPPPLISPLGSPSDNPKEFGRARKSSKDDSTGKKPIIKEDPPKADPTTGLSGVIIDDDEEEQEPTRDRRATDNKASPRRNSRLDEVRGSAGRDTGSGGGGTPSSTASSNKNTPVKKVSRLVSYYNEEDDMDDSAGSGDEPDEVLHSEPMDTGTDGEDSSSQHLSGGSRGPSHSSSPRLSTTGVVITSSGGIKVNGITLPSAPIGKKCSQTLQDKISRAVAGVKGGAKDYNTLLDKKEFRNPSIYEKLVDHLRLDENGTNYPVALYDPHCWGKESYYEELARVQKEEMEKREKERKERTKVDFISGMKKSAGGTGVEEETKKRKSRFDAGRPEINTVGTISKPVGLVSTLPSSVVPSTTAAAAAAAAAKTTIDAFGSLKKLKT
uniref:SAP30-binding protein-like n=2 Tax=Hirondellea gigas TaxID=1518452 RepID=A0A6A7G6J2_9CRUS